MIHHDMAAVNLAGRVALITGAGSGIGRATALQFAASSCRICLVDINPATLKETAYMCLEQGTRVEDIVTVVKDLTVENHIQQVTDVALGTFGKVNILINNAGMMHSEDSSTHQVSSKALDYIYMLLLKTPILLAKRLIPTLKENDGCVINIASVSGVISSPGMVAYTVSKAGVISFTKAAAKELAPLVRVNSISPGLVDTNIVKVITDEKKRQILMDNKVAQLPLKRVGQPEEIARAAVYLARETFITGTNLLVDGGESLPLYNETVLQRNVSKV